MKLIVGLGNPGEEYDMTRHNLGFLVMDRFLKDITSVKDSKWSESSKLKSQFFITEWQPKLREREKIIIAKPETYMNNSGMAVKLLLDFYKLDTNDLWVVHDDLDLPLGKLKIRFGGAGAGHHGVEHVIDTLESDKFWRFRLGIGNPRHSIDRKDGEGIDKMIGRRHLGDTKGFVLGGFDDSEWPVAKKLIKDTVKSLQIALEGGLDSAMNRFNTK